MPKDLEKRMNKKGKIIISLSGKAKSGKDTLADYFVKEHGFIKMAWAANLKSMCKKVFNLSDHQIYTQEGKETRFETPKRLDSVHIQRIFDWMQETDKLTPKHAENYSSINLKYGDGVEFNYPREILQFVGTEICRGIKEDYHTSVLVKKIEDLPQDSKIIITDSRFPNEVETVKSIGGITVKIIRKNAGIEQSSHASEALVDTLNVDYLIKNDSSLENLYEKAGMMYESYS